MERPEVATSWRSTGGIETEGLDGHSAEARCRSLRSLHHIFTPFWSRHDGEIEASDSLPQHWGRRDRRSRGSQCGGMLSLASVSPSCPTWLSTLYCNYTTPQWLTPLPRLLGVRGAGQILVRILIDFQMQEISEGMRNQVEDQMREEGG